MSVLEQLNNLSKGDLMSCYNQYAQNNSYEEVYNNDEDFFQMCYGTNIMDAVRAVSFGEYNYHHNFVMLDGYANLESSNYVADLIDLDDLASYIEDNISDFSEWIEEEEEEEEVLTNSKKH